MATPHTLKLAAVLDLGAATPLAKAIGELRGSDLALDGSEVSRLGGQCLQVLISARRSWAVDERRLTINDASENLLAAISQFGAMPLLFDQEDATP